MKGKKSEIPYLRAFKISYLGPTANQGARVKITDLNRMEENKKSRILSWDYRKNFGWEIAAEYLKKIGINILYRISDKENDYLITDDLDKDLT